MKEEFHGARAGHKDAPRWHEEMKEVHKNRSETRTRIVRTGTASEMKDGEK
jgi:hypothetical protein